MHLLSREFDTSVPSLVYGAMMFDVRATKNGGHKNDEILSIGVKMA